MSEKVIVPIENYKKLGCAIIKTAVDDYIYGDLSEEYLKYFLYNTLWIKCLDLNIDYLFNLAKEKHDERE